MMSKATSYVKGTVRGAAAIAIVALILTPIYVKSSSTLCNASLATTARMKAQYEVTKAVVLNGHGNYREEETAFVVVCSSR